MTEVDAGDPLDLALRYRALRARHPQLQVLGGCCGTDHRHVEAIARACVFVPTLPVAFRLESSDPWQRPLSNQTGQWGRGGIVQTPLHAPAERTQPSSARTYAVWVESGSIR